MDRAVSDTLQGSSKGKEDDSVLVATLGMFIIDTFRFQDAVTGDDLGDRNLGEQVGGGGTYFAIGARIWLPSEKLLMTVDRGIDFSTAVQDALDSYVPRSTKNSANKHRLWRFRQRQGQTTKAVNTYRGQLRGFEYLTPKIRLDPHDLIDGDTLSRLPKFIHCICSPERAMEISSQIESMHTVWPRSDVRPIVIWEPIPDSAVVQNLDAAVQAAANVQVVSPNHEEAASLLGRKESLTSKASIEEISLILFEKLRQGSKRTPILCIRSGAHGALIISSNGDKFWVPAYHEDVEKIVDVTGAGNAWLGGFVAGLAQSRMDSNGWTLDDLTRSAQMGTVSAAYTIEQRGLPQISYHDQGRERWNDDDPDERLRSLARLQL